MNRDSVQIVKSCEGCQKHGYFSHQPASIYKPIISSCPFDQWGLDIVGPLPIARAQKKFLLVDVDYFSKWVEAEPLARITEDEVLKFLWKNIVCRFGIPRKLVSDNGRQFQGGRIQSWCQEMKINQSFTSVAYPQANGQTGVINRILMQALKTRLEGVGQDWVEELPGVLWAYRTTPKTATGETPFSLVYGSEAVLPVEIGQSSARIAHYNEDCNQEAQTNEMELIEEKRERATIRMESYRNRVARAYNKRLRPRSFQTWDLVLKRVNPAGDVKKLVAKWEGPYKIHKQGSSGALYLEDARVD